LGLKLVVRTKERLRNNESIIIIIDRGNEGRHQQRLENKQEYKKAEMREKRLDLMFLSKALIFLLDVN
jgi:hypothetical protein